MKTDSGKPRLYFEVEMNLYPYFPYTIWVIFGTDTPQMWYRCVGNEDKTAYHYSRHKIEVIDELHAPTAWSPVSITWEAEWILHLFLIVVSAGYRTTAPNPSHKWLRYPSIFCSFVAGKVMKSIRVNVTLSRHWSLSCAVHNAD